MKKLLLTERALDDIQEIYGYSVEEFGERTASKYIRGIEDCLTLLKENSGLLRHNKRISSRFIVYPVQKHFLICDIINDSICVLTIKHVSMNLLERLKKLEPTLEDEAKTLFGQAKQ